MPIRCLAWGVKNSNIIHKNVTVRVGESSTDAQKCNDTKHVICNEVRGVIQASIQLNMGEDPCDYIR